MNTDATEVLAELEQLALAGLRREVERLRRAMDEDEEEQGDEAAAGQASLDRYREHQVSLARHSGVRMSCLDALELYAQAHDLRVQLQAEEEDDAL